MTRFTDSHPTRSNALSVSRISSAHNNGFHTRGTSTPWPREMPRSAMYRGAQTHTVLVPLDGSQAAEHALPYAIEVARRSGAAIRLVYVQTRAAKPWQRYFTGTVQKRLKREREAYLQSVVRRVGERVESQVGSMVIDSSDTAQSLCDAAVHASLVVMATSRRGFLGRLLHRSVSEMLTRTLPCPLLLVTATGSEVDLSGDPLIRKVLIPLDGTRSSESAMASAAGLGWLSGARFTLVHFQDLEQTFQRSGLGDPHGYLRSTAAPWEESSMKVNTEVLINDQPIARAILSRVEEHDFDLIALAPSKRSGMDRLLNRSVADSLLREAKTPVLMFPQPAPEADCRDR